MISSTQRILGVAVLAALIVVVGWYFALWSPQSHGLHHAQASRTTARQHVAALVAQKNQLQALLPQIPADKVKLHTLQTALPDNPSLNAALRDLHNAATAAGVQLSIVQSTPPVGSATAGIGSSSTPNLGVPAISVQMTLSGNNQQIMTFLHSLATMPRVLTVDGLTVSNAQGVSLNARIFYAGQPTP